MFDLNKHLDSDEKLLYFFRPSRKAYILEYILFLAIASISMSVQFYLIVFGLGIQDINKNIMWSFISLFALAALAMFAAIMLIRIEWRIISRRYGITDERLLNSRGIFNETFRSIKYEYMTDISFRQTFWDKIMNTGTLDIDTAGTDEQKIVYRKISDPLKVKKMINDQQPEPAKKGKALF